MDKALEIKERKGIIKKFVDFHKRNSSWNQSYGCYQLNLDFLKDDHDDEEYFAIFKSLLIRHFEINPKKKMPSEIPSFIFYEQIRKKNEDSIKEKPATWLARIFKVD